MITVCHVTSVHKSTDVRIFYKMCTSLAEQGYKTYLVAPGESRKENGVEVVGVGEKSKNRLQRMLLFSKKVCKKALELDADIYHLHDPELLFYVKYFHAADKKVIFDSHEDVPAQILEKQWLPKGIRQNISGIAERYMRSRFKYLDSFIGASPHICQRFQKTEIRNIFIANYPIISKKQYVAPKFSSKTLVFAGQVNEQWSQQKIIRTIGELHDSEVGYLFCGPVDSDYLMQLQGISGWKQAIYKGVIPHQQVEPLLRQGIAGLALLQYSPNVGGEKGTLGNTKLFEYMAAGIPVIATNFTLWREIVEKSNCGILVNPNDEKNILQAMQELLNNPEKARTFGENGRKSVEKIYNWDVEANKLYTLYEDLLED